MQDRNKVYSKRKQQVHRQLMLIGIIVVFVIILIVSCSIRASVKKQEAKVKAQAEQTVKKVEKNVEKKTETPKQRLKRVKAEAVKKGYPANVIELLDKNPETVEYVEDYEKKKDQPSAAVVSDSLVKGQIPHLLQWDERWGYAPYGTGNIATAGCGPTCMSMIITGLTGDASVTPVVVADFAVANKLIDEENNTYWELMRDAAKNWNISCYEGNPTEEVVSAELQAGHPIICSVKPGDFTKTGHFIVLTQYKDGQVKVHDPFSQKNTDKLWTFAQIKDQIKAMWVYSYNQ